MGFWHTLALVLFLVQPLAFGPPAVDRPEISRALSEPRAGLRIVPPAPAAAETGFSPVTRALVVGAAAAALGLGALGLYTAGRNAYRARGWQLHRRREAGQRRRGKRRSTVRR